MNKFIMLFVIISGSLVAWEDHPDKENKVCESECFVESGYDWSKRDPDSKDSNDACELSEGTRLNGPDRDK